MNAIAAAGNPLGALAAFFPSPVASSTPSAPVFLNLISALFSPQSLDAKLIIPETPLSLESDELAAPSHMGAAQLGEGQIADAIIRSMLGDRTVPSRHLPLPLQANVTQANVNHANVNQGNAAPSPIATPVAGPVSDSPVPVIITMPVPPPQMKNAPLPIAANPDLPPPPAPQISAPAPPANQKKVRNAPLCPLPATQNISAAPAAATPPAPAATVILVTVATVEPLPEADPVTAPATPAQPLPARTIDPHPAPAPQSELAFSARLTPLESPGANFEATLTSPEQPPPSCAPASPQPDSRSLPPLSPVAPDPHCEIAPPQSNTPLPPSEAAPPPPAPPPPRSAGPEPAQTAVSVKTASAPPPPDTPVRIVAPASSTGDFSRSLNTPFSETPVPPVPAAGTKPETPFRISDTPHADDPRALALPPPQPPSVQDITVRIARPEAPSVDLHVTQRAGEIQVSVRTPDPALQISLRQDLNTLTSSLERAGFRTETALPLGETSSRMNSRDQRPPQQEFSGRGNSGDGSPGRRQQQHQHQRDQRPQHWLDELEKTT